MSEGEKGERGERGKAENAIEIIKIRRQSLFCLVSSRYENVRWKMPANHSTLPVTIGEGGNRRDTRIPPLEISAWRDGIGSHCKYFC